MVPSQPHRVVQGITPEASSSREAAGSKDRDAHWVASGESPSLLIHGPHPAVQSGISSERSSGSSETVQRRNRGWEGNSML